MAPGAATGDLDATFVQFGLRKESSGLMNLQIISDVHTALRFLQSQAR
jgi:hypothetical protein